MQIKFFLKRLSLFLVFACCCYILLLAVFSLNSFRNKVPNLIDMYAPNVREAFQEIHDSTNTDILFIGSSHAEFVPIVFKKNGISAINLSINSLRPSITYYLLKNELKRSSAKIVVLESYFTLFNEDYLVQEAALRIMSNEDINLNLTRMALTTKNFKVINSEIGLIINRVLHPLMNEKTSVVLKDTGKNESPDPSSELASNKPHIRSVSHSAFVYFQDCIDLIKEGKKLPLLIMAPVTRECIHHSWNYSAICYSIDSVAKKNGILFINYNDSANYIRIGLDDKKDFVDDNHLTRLGRLKFSRVVAEDIKQYHIL